MPDLHRNIKHYINASKKAVPYNPKEVRRRKVLITNNILHKQGAGPTPEHQNIAILQAEKGCPTTRRK
jgi:hypothetical protein